MTAEEILNKHIDSSSSEGVVPVVVDAMREFANQEVAEYREALSDAFNAGYLKGYSDASSRTNFNACTFEEWKSKYFNETQP
jgi:hypothetical protein